MFLIWIPHWFLLLASESIPFLLLYFLSTVLQDQLSQLFTPLPLWNRSVIRCRKVTVHTILKNKWKSLITVDLVINSAHLYSRVRKGPLRPHVPKQWGGPTLKMLQRSSKKAQEMCTLSFGFHSPCESPFPSHSSVIWSTACAAWPQLIRCFQYLITCLTEWHT